MVDDLEPRDVGILGRVSSGNLVLHLSRMCSVETHQLCHAHGSSSNQPSSPEVAHIRVVYTLYN